VAKASKTFVDWLREGERGWVSHDGLWRWRHRDGKMWAARYANRKWWWGTSQLSIDECERDKGQSATEVYPRPAPRRKVRKVRAWAVLDDGKLRGLYCTRTDAKAACTGWVKWAVVKLTGEYTPKKARLK
jgi:hypothetical protein